MGRPRGRPRSVDPATCAQHPGSQVAARGERPTAGGGVTRRYQCTPAIGERHWFSVRLTPAKQVSSWSLPPPCPDHPGSKVVRNGTYGKSTPKPRQRYRCTPADGTKPHSFTPPLPRDHVHENEEHCDHCDELRGIHRGETAVARRHSWSTRIVARGLEQLAAGASYAEVGRWALRATGTKRTRTPTPTADTPSLAAGGKRKRRPSPASKEARNAWHIAADWCEAFSSVVYGPVDEMLRAHALAERDRLDALRGAGRPLVRPQVVLVDDLPVYGRGLDKKNRKRRDAGYFVLVVAEQHWPEPTPDDDDPFVIGSHPVTKLRLVRAMAKSNTPAWRILFDELGYEPDFIIADAGTGIAGAIKKHYESSSTRFIPSLWHLTQAIEKALADTPGAFIATPAGKQLIDPINEHLHQLGRHSGVLNDSTAWSAWWDELLALVKANRLPAEKIRAARGRYETSMADVLDDLAHSPQVPVSTGGLETLMARQVKPLLAMRRTSFANLERTNLLFDLVVARQHGMFDNLAHVAKLLRQDTETHQGWTVALRSVSDPRPIGGVYSSLRDTTLLTTIAEQRGVT